MESRQFFEDIHRRYGKSHVLMVIAIEIGLGKAPEVWPEMRRVIRFSAPTLLDLEEIYHPIVEDILETCPDEIRPVWQQSRGRGHYHFPSTGTRLYLFGIDAKHYKKGRGKKSHLSVVDEAGACEPGCEGGVSGYVRSILVPQTFGCNGRIVIPTTPPETPGHPSALLKAACQAVPGAYVKRTLDDNARWFGADVVREYERECGGRETTAFRREYLCEWIIDETRAAVPEFEKHASAIVKAPELPSHFFPLVGMDVGFDDWTAILFGCWDFKRAKLIVQDEVFIRRGRTDMIAAELRAMEEKLWPWAPREMLRDKDGRYVHEPWRTERLRTFRHSDTDLRLIADLQTIHGLSFSPTRKDEKEAQVNELRMFVKDERLEIAPRCTHLVTHLRTTVWNKQRTQWERTIDGHGDGVDALLYLLRNAPRALNPYPPAFDGVDPRGVFMPLGQENEQRSGLGASMRRIFPGRA